MTTTGNALSQNQNEGKVGCAGNEDQLQGLFYDMLTTIRPGEHFALPTSYKQKPMTGFIEILDAFYGTMNIRQTGSGIVSEVSSSDMTHKYSSDDVASVSTSTLGASSSNNISETESSTTPESMSNEKVAIIPEEEDEVDVNAISEQGESDDLKCPSSSSHLEQLESQNFLEVSDGPSSSHLEQLESQNFLEVSDGPDGTDDNNGNDSTKQLLDEPQTVSVDDINNNVQTDEKKEEEDIQDNANVKCEYVDVGKIPPPMECIAMTTPTSELNLLDNASVKCEAAGGGDVPPSMECQVTPSIYALNPSKSVTVISPEDVDEIGPPLLELQPESHFPKPFPREVTELQKEIQWYSNEIEQIKRILSENMVPAPSSHCLQLSNDVHTSTSEINSILIGGGAVESFSQEFVDAESEISSVSSTRRSRRKDGYVTASSDGEHLWTSASASDFEDADFIE